VCICKHEVVDVYSAMKATADHTENVTRTLTGTLMTWRNGDTGQEMRQSPRILITVTGTKTDEKSIELEMKYAW